MSRSRRKTPVIGFTTCRSERQDKKIWHQRWRARERTALTSTNYTDFDAYLPLLEKQVSNAWDMGKDGKQYWPKHKQSLMAELTAKHKGRTSKERASLKLRQEHKSIGK